MAGRLAGEVALITGASRGQGEAEARMFAQEGAQVVVTDILDDLGKKVAQSIGASALYVRLDVSQEADWQKAVEATIKAFGPASAAAAFDLQGHRGARGLAPENTLEGFGRALSIGVSTLEFDLGMSKDGVVVVQHDIWLNPDTTRGPTACSWRSAGRRCARSRWRSCSATTSGA